MFSKPRSQGDKFGKQKCLVFGVAHVGVLFFFTQASSDSVAVSPKSRYTPLPSASRELTSHRGRNRAFYCVLWLQERYRAVRSLGIITAALALWMEQVIFKSVIRKPYLSSLIILTHIK